MRSHIAGAAHSVILLCVVLLTLLSACDQPPTPQLPDAQQILRMSAPGLGTPEPALPVYYPGAYGDQQELSFLFSGLVTLDARLKPVLWDADHLSVSDDDTVYTFHLRPTLRFSDGSRITSADFAYSLNRALSPCLTHTIALDPRVAERYPYSYVPTYEEIYLGSLKDATIFDRERCDANGAIVAAASGQSTPLIPTLIGDALQTPAPDTLVLILTHPDAALLAKLAEPIGAVVERSVVERWGNQWVNHLTDHGAQGTSGMYAVKSLTDGSGPTVSAVTLVRDPHFWGPHPKLREVDIAFTQTGAPDGPLQTAYNGYTQGKVDADLLPLPSTIASTAAQRASIHQFSAPEIVFIALNWTTPPFNDLRVRQALALALDKTALAAETGGIATNSLIPSGVPGYTTNLNGSIAAAPLSGNPAQAAALWNSYVATNCNGMPSRCQRIYINSYGSFEGPASIKMWQKTLPGIPIAESSFHPFIGDGAKPRYIEWDEFWADYADPQEWLSYIFSDAIESNSALTTIRDKPASDLMAQANVTSNPAARSALYQQAEQTLLNDVAVIPLYQPQRTWAIHSYVANYPIAIPWYRIDPMTWATIYLKRH